MSFVHFSNSHAPLEQALLFEQPYMCFTHERMYGTKQSFCLSNYVMYLVTFTAFIICLMYLYLRIFF